MVPAGTGTPLHNRSPRSPQRSHSMTEIEMDRYRHRSVSIETDHSEDLDLEYDDNNYNYNFNDNCDEESPLASSPLVDYASSPSSTLKHLDPSDVSFIRSFLRVFLVVCTALVAAFIPNIGMLVSLAGATSGTSLALIFPPLLEVCVSRQQRVVVSQTRLIFCFVSICVGVIGAILGTLMSLSDIYFTFRSS
jgi:hypothetical protein